MASKYSVVILKETGKDKFTDVKSFPVTNLELARSVFSHHAKFVKWSRQYKESMGLNPRDHGLVWLYDNTCHYELEEARF